MLYSIKLGNAQDINDDWEVTTDDFNNKFLSCQGLFQRIKLDKENAEKEIVFASSNAYIKSYYLPPFIKFVNNTRNLALSMKNFYVKRENIESYVDDSIAFVTLNTNNYKLLKYDLGQNSMIVGTYKKKDSHQGCVITFPSNNGDDPIITLYVFDYKTNRITEIKVKIGDTPNAEKNFVAEKDQAELYKIFKKNSKRLIHFTTSFPSEYLPTKTFIVSPDKVDLTHEICKNNKGAKIVTIPDDASEEEILNILKDALGKEKIKSVTTVGFDIPFEVSKELKLNYIFAWDEEWNVAIPVRSN